MGVNCIEPSTSVRLPWKNTPAYFATEKRDIILKVGSWPCPQILDLGGDD